MPKSANFRRYDSLTLNVYNWKTILISTFWYKNFGLKIKRNMLLAGDASSLNPVYTYTYIHIHMHIHICMQDALCRTDIKTEGVDYRVWWGFSGWRRRTSTPMSLFIGPSSCWYRRKYTGVHHKPPYKSHVPQGPKVVLGVFS